MIGYPLQVTGITLLEVQPLETFVRGALIAGSNKIPGDIDTDDFRSGARKRDGGRTISAAKIQDRISCLDMWEYQSIN